MYKREYDYLIQIDSVLNSWDTRKCLREAASFYLGNLFRKVYIDLYEDEKDLPSITLFFATIPSEKITSLTNFYRNLYSKERNHQSDLHQFIHSLALHTLNINIEKIDECVAQAFVAGIIGTLAVCSYDLKKGDVSPKENNVVLCDSTPICTYETDNGWLLVYRIKSK